MTTTAERIEDASPDDVLDIPRACAFLGGISSRQLHRFVKLDGLPSARISPQRRVFLRSDLIAWVKAKTSAGEVETERKVRRSTVARARAGNAVRLVKDRGAHA